jgi:hypothetical protein
MKDKIRMMIGIGQIRLEELTDKVTIVQRYQCSNKLDLSGNSN